jgi:hypothetical protein
MHSTLIIETQREITQAAEALANENAVIQVRLELWRHNLERDEEEHGAQHRSFETVVPLSKASEIVFEIPQTPINQKELTTKGGCIINGGLNFHVFTPNDVGMKLKTCQHGNSIIEGDGVPSRKTPNSLTVFPAAGGSKETTWTLQLEFTPTSSVLSKVSFTHDPNKHIQLTGYLFAQATHNYMERILLAKVPTLNIR